MLHEQKFLSRKHARTKQVLTPTSKFKTYELTYTHLPSCRNILDLNRSLNSRHSTTRMKACIGRTGLERLGSGTLGLQYQLGNIRLEGRRPGILDSLVGVLT